MATYVPNATQATEPVASQTVFSAAEEFRTLKASVNAMRQWLGTSATAPTTDTLGNALTAGDFYYNTVSQKMFVYSGTVWQSIGRTAQIVSVYNQSGYGLGVVQLDILVFSTPASNFSFSDAGILPGQSILILVVNPGTYTVTWPTGIKWLNGVTPTLLAAGATFVEIMKIGSTLYGVALGGAV